MTSLFTVHPVKTSSFNSAHRRCSLCGVQLWDIRGRQCFEPEDQLIKQSKLWMLGAPKVSTRPRGADISSQLSYRTLVFNPFFDKNQTSLGWLNHWATKEHCACFWNDNSILNPHPTPYWGHFKGDPNKGLFLTLNAECFFSLFRSLTGAKIFRPSLSSIVSHLTLTR